MAGVGLAARRAVGAKDVGDLQWRPAHRARQAGRLRRLDLGRSRSSGLRDAGDGAGDDRV